MMLVAECATRAALRPCGSAPHSAPRSRAAAQARRTLGGAARSEKAALLRGRGVLARAEQKPGAGAGGLFGNMANMGGFMEQMKSAQADAQRMQLELAATDFEGFSSDETVRAVVDGAQEPKGCDITEAAMEQGAERVSQLVNEAYKDARAKSMAAMKERMLQLMQGRGR